MEFKAFSKIPRLSKKAIISEKIDGSNAAIVIENIGPNDPDEPRPLITFGGEANQIVGMWAQSRSRFITPESDNFGFAKWVLANNEELRALGHGHHYGEWWGSGIQRGYGLSEKRFSLFNTGRWSDPESRPKCCHVVPVINQWENGNLEDAADYALGILQREGSHAAPGFMKPEGVVVYYPAADYLFKKTFDDNLPKYLAEAKNNKNKEKDHDFLGYPSERNKVSESNGAHVQPA